MDRSSDHLSAVLPSLNGHGRNHFVSISVHRGRIEAHSAHLGGDHDRTRTPHVRIAYPFLRIAMGIVLVWTGGLKFVDPSPVVGLIGASPFNMLASNGFVYMLGVGEVVIGVLLFANIRVKYVGILTMGLFVGTLAILILILTPKVAYGDAGFPLLSLPGEFLL